MYLSILQRVIQPLNQEEYHKDFGFWVKLPNFIGILEEFSRQIALLSITHAQMTRFDTFQELYLKDLSFGKIYVELAEVGK
jgi:hypothetical protein